MLPAENSSCTALLELADQPHAAVGRQKLVARKLQAGQRGHEFPPLHSRLSALGGGGLSHSRALFLNRMMREERGRWQATTPGRDGIGGLVPWAKVRRVSGRTAEALPSLPAGGCSQFCSPNLWLVAISCDNDQAKFGGGWP